MEFSDFPNPCFLSHHWVDCVLLHFEILFCEKPSLLISNINYLLSIIHINPIINSNNLDLAFFAIFIQNISTIYYYIL